VIRGASESDIELDGPDESAGGTNPDTTATIAGVRRGIEPAGGTLNGCRAARIFHRRGHVKPSRKNAPLPLSRQLWLREVRFTPRCFAH